jgi:UDP-glucose 4-epimerase
MRLRPVMAGANEPYRYEREVEEFLRWSPHVRRDEPGARGRQEAGLMDPSPPVEESTNK